MGKIFQNKHLAVGLLMGHSRLGIPMMDVSWFEAQGQMSHRRGCELWKSAEWAVVAGASRLEEFSKKCDVGGVACGRCPPTTASGRVEFFFFRL
jgi:hypothetical protein